MGLIDAGTPLSHEVTMKLAQHVREHGILQFINLFKRQKNRKNDNFKWGDEIEYTIVKFDENKKEAKLNLKSEEILHMLKAEDGFWAPEYGAFMIEGTPAKPYEGLIFSCVEENMRKRRKEVKKILKADEDLMCITSFPRMGCENFTYPATKPTPIDGLTKSIFFPDACIFPGHPRYKNTTTNIMRRRGEKPFFNLPVFKDKFTKTPVDECYKYEKNAVPDQVYLDSMGFGCGYSCLQVTFQAFNLNEARTLYDQLSPFCPILMALTAAAPFHRGFITDVDTRWNILCNTQDCRTREEKGLEPLRKNKFVLKKSRHDSIDCYISPEGQKYNDLPVLYHSEDYKKLVDNGIDSVLAQHIAHLFIRDTISMFEEKIHQNDEEEIDHFENIQSTVWQTMRLKPPPLNSSIGWRVEFRPCDVQITDFENAAVVSFLALLTRVILTYKLDFLIPISKIDENIQRAQKRNASQEQKFWFRKDIFQTTSKERKNRTIKTWNLRKTILDDENIDYITTENRNIDRQFVQKVETRRYSLQLKNELNISKNGNSYKENVKYSKLLKYKFISNGNISNTPTKNIFNDKQYMKNFLKDNGNLENVYKEKTDINKKPRNIKNGLKNNGNMLYNNSVTEMTIDEIMNGKNDDFPGIISLMKKYLDTLELDVIERCHIQRYLSLFEGRASGKIQTAASWMRKFAKEHPDYKCDSIVTERMNFDLLKMIQAIQNGETTCPELLGQIYCTDN